MYSTRGARQTRRFLNESRYHDESGAGGPDGEGTRLQADGLGGSTGEFQLLAFVTIGISPKGMCLSPIFDGMPQSSRG